MDGGDASHPPGLLDGRYALESPIGEGGMAIVWRAMDVNLKQPRAIKIIRGSGRAATLRVRRLGAEGRALSRLESVRHPNLVRVFEYKEYADPDTGEARAYIVMDLVVGGTLEDQIRALGAIPARRAVRWIVQVLSALGAAHQASVVHRDVKPSNILLDRRQNAVLADFGIAMLVDDEDRFTRTGVMMGSVSFAAPEQRLSAKSAGPEADLYSAGATLYQMVTGLPPDHLFAESPAEARWLAVDEPLRSVLVKAMQKRPEDRYPTAYAMADALEACLPGLPPDPVADGLARVDARDPDTEDLALPTLGQTLTDDGLPAEPPVAPSAVRTVAGSWWFVWGAGAALGALSLGLWLPGQLTPAEPAASAAVPAPEVSAVAALPGPVAAPQDGGAPSPAAVVPAQLPATTVARPARRAQVSRPPEPDAPPAVTPEMSGIAGAWGRSVGTAGTPSQLVIGGSPSSLSGTWSVSAAGVVLRQGRLLGGTWDAETGVASIAFSDLGPVQTMELRVVDIGTLHASCCGAASKVVAEAQYRRTD